MKRQKVNEEFSLLLKLLPRDLAILIYSLWRKERRRRYDLWLDETSEPYWNRWMHGVGQRGSSESFQHGCIDRVNCFHYFSYAQDREKLYPLKETWLHFCRAGRNDDENASLERRPLGFPCSCGAEPPAFLSINT